MASESSYQSTPCFVTTGISGELTTGGRAGATVAPPRSVLSSVSVGGWAEIGGMLATMVVPTSGIVSEGYGGVQSGDQISILFM
jgi:hypothetical protein